jgi:FimV-like protein
MNMRTAVLAAMLSIGAPAIALAQTAADHIAEGDREHAAMNIDAALKHYQAAIQAEPNNYEALWKASREAVDLGEFAPSKDEQVRLYAEAEKYARQAVEANPSDAEGHFNLARAIGRNALRMGTRDRIKYAKVVRAEALEALKYNPQHAGALHVMGVWNAEVMRLNGFSRMVAKNFLGGQIFGEANWKEAVRYMEASVAAEPDRLVHHLDLAKVYRDVGDKEKARAEFQAVIDGKALDHNDQFYKQDAERELAKLR